MATKPPAGRKSAPSKTTSRVKTAGRESLAGKLIGAHSRQLERQIAKDGIGGLLPLYRDAKAELAARLSKIGADSKPSQLQVQAMIRQAEGVMERLGEQQGKLLGDVTSSVVETGVGQVAEEYRQMARRITGTTPVLDLERGAQFRGLVKDVDSSLLRRRSLQIGTWTQQAVLNMEQQLSVGFMTGKPIHTMINDLMGAQGLLDSERYRAERIVRTEGAFGHGAARWGAIRRAKEELGEERMMKRLVETFDDRTGDDSFVIHGQTVPVEQPFSWKYRVGGVWLVKQYQHPPNRPNDRAVVIPWDPEWKDEELERPLSMSELRSAPTTRWRKTVGVKIPPGHRPGRSYTDKTPDPKKRAAEREAEPVEEIQDEVVEEAAPRAPEADPMLLDSPDAVIDAGADLEIGTRWVAKTTEKELNMRRAHAAGKKACELCGRALAPGYVVVADCPIGPECVKKLKKAGYKFNATKPPEAAKPTTKPAAPARLAEPPPDPQPTPPEPIPPPPEPEVASAEDDQKGEARVEFASREDFQTVVNYMVKSEGSRYEHNREKAIKRALAQGLRPCAKCGKPVKEGRGRDYGFGVVGPECNHFFQANARLMILGTDTLPKIRGRILGKWS